MKVKFTEWYKEVSCYKAIKSNTVEVDKDAFIELMKMMKAVETAQGKYWKQTAYDHGETYEIIGRNK